MYIKNNYLYINILQKIIIYNFFKSLNLNSPLGNSFILLFPKYL